MSYIEKENAIDLLSMAITMSTCLSVSECEAKRLQQEIDLELIKSIPAADVQPVVTCGECKYRHDFKRQGCQGRKPEWFCADGERLINGAEMKEEQT